MRKALNRIMRATFAGAACLAMTMSFTSCSDDNEATVQDIPWTFTFDITGGNIFTPEGYWKDVYSTSINTIQLSPNLIMSHKAESTVYDGVEYKSWLGFCPSRADDTADQGVNGDWTDHQWGSITGGGANGSSDYMLCFWDVQESLRGIPEKPSLLMIFVEMAVNGLTVPRSVDITNSTWGYYAMKNGTPYSAAFGPDDWCKVIFIGVAGEAETGRVEFYLAKDGQILDEWATVSLTALGEVNAVYMQMESSQSGQWGMNNPAYFCIDNLKATLRAYN